MSPFRNLKLAALALTGGLALVVLPAASAVTAGASLAQPTPPHIVVSPNNVMVNHHVTLVGTGFRPNSTLTIKECSRRQWTVMQNPCDTNNAIVLTTNSNGGFTVSMVAELCPALTGRGGTPLPAETCFVGHPEPRGIDGITLIGAAKLVVTYP